MRRMFKSKGFSKKRKYIKMKKRSRRIKRFGASRGGYRL